MYYLRISSEVIGCLQPTPPSLYKIWWHEYSLWPPLHTLCSAQKELHAQINQGWLSLEPWGKFRYGFVLLFGASSGPIPKAVPGTGNIREQLDSFPLLQSPSFSGAE